MEPDSLNSGSVFYRDVSVEVIGGVVGGVILAVLLFVVPPIRKWLWKKLDQLGRWFKYRFGRIGGLPLSIRKKKTNILFVDDDRTFKIASILRSSGWENVKRIDDVRSIDDDDIVDTHILFIDIQGVGRVLRFQDEGLGLAEALKDRYPEKFIIVYSAVSTGDRLHPALNKVDRILRKNASTYEFQSIIEDFSSQLRSVK